MIIKCPQEDAFSFFTLEIRIYLRELCGLYLAAQPSGWCSYADFEALLSKRIVDPWNEIISAYYWYNIHYGTLTQLPNHAWWCVSGQCMGPQSTALETSTVMSVVTKVDVAPEVSGYDDKCSFQLQRRRNIYTGMSMNNIDLRDDHNFIVYSRCVTSWAPMCKIGIH